MWVVMGLWGHAHHAGAVGRGDVARWGVAIWGHCHVGGRGKVAVATWGDMAMW